MDALTKPLFLGRLSHERLTSNQLVGHCLEAQAAHLFLLGPNESSFISILDVVDLHIGRDLLGLHIFKYIG